MRYSGVAVAEAGATRKKTWEELSGRGVVFDGPPKKESWGSFVTLRDPGNNQILLSSR